MHNDRITHRDLKPENLFVVEAAPNWRFKIGDFGIAKRFQNENSILRTRAGTQAYLAPEVRGILDSSVSSTAYTSTVDVWAAGIIVHEMLMLQRPFESIGDLTYYCQRVLCFPMYDGSSSNASPDVIDFLHQALAATPVMRPAAPELLRHRWFRKLRMSAIDFKSSYTPSEDSTTISDINPTRITIPSIAHGNTASERKSKPQGVSEIRAIISNYEQVPSVFVSGARELFNGSFNMPVRPDRVPLGENTILLEDAAEQGIQFQVVDIPPGVPTVCYNSARIQQVLTLKVISLCEETGWRSLTAQENKS